MTYRKGDIVRYKVSESEVSDWLKLEYDLTPVSVYFIDRPYKRKLCYKINGTVIPVDYIEKLNCPVLQSIQK